MALLLLVSAGRRSELIRAQDQPACVQGQATAGQPLPCPAHSITLQQTCQVNDANSTDSWGLVHVYGQEAWALFPNCTPAGIRIGIVDTGLSKGAYAAGGDLEGRVGYLVNYTSDADTNDNVGHGTHIAGIIAADANNGLGIAGIAPTAILDIHKVATRAEVLACPSSNSPCNGPPVNRMANAIHNAVDLGDKVISVSFGTNWDEFQSGNSVIPCVDTPANRPRCGGVLENAVRYAQSRNVTLVASVGEDKSCNEGGKPRQVLPAGFADIYANVIAVTASGIDDRPATCNGRIYSDGGDWVTLAAPGGGADSGILSLFATDSIGQRPVPCPNGDPNCTLMAGNSTATAYVAGVVALALAANPGLSPATIRTMLTDRNNLTPWPEVTQGRYGAGIVNARRVVLAAQNSR